jgi:hypothetical protein
MPSILTAINTKRQSLDWHFVFISSYFGIYPLAPIEAASSCGGVRHKRYSDKREIALNKITNIIVLVIL